MEMNMLCIIDEANKRGDNHLLSGVLHHLPSHADILKNVSAHPPHREDNGRGNLLYMFTHPVLPDVLNFIIR